MLLDVPAATAKAAAWSRRWTTTCQPAGSGPQKESAGSTQADTLIRYAQANPATAARHISDMTEMSDDELDQSLSSIEQQLLIATLLDPMLDFIAEVRLSSRSRWPRLPSLATDKRVEMLGNNPDSGWECSRQSLVQPTEHRRANGRSPWPAE